MCCYVLFKVQLGLRYNQKNATFKNEFRNWTNKMLSYRRETALQGAL